MNFFSEKVSQCRKKNKMGDPLRFFNIHSVAKYKKIQGGPLRKIGGIGTCIVVKYQKNEGGTLWVKKFEKLLAMPEKIERGDFSGFFI